MRHSIASRFPAVSRRPGGASTSPSLWSSATAIVLVLAGVKLLATVSFSGRYGYHRDELYYIACGRHLALGYVDFPPVVPLLARLSEILFGSSLRGIRRDHRLQDRLFGIAEISGIRCARRGISRSRINGVRTRIFSNIAFKRPLVVCQSANAG